MAMSQAAVLPCGLNIAGGCRTSATPQPLAPDHQASFAFTIPATDARRTPNLPDVTSGKPSQ